MYPLATLADKYDIRHLHEEIEVRHTTSFPYLISVLEKRRSVQAGYALLPLR
jgi:hypothetical protein